MTLQSRQAILRRRIAACALLAATLAGGAHAQQYLYRGMAADPATPGQPVLQVSALGLTVRPGDVAHPGAGALVQPTDGHGHGQGMSVIWSDTDADACQLPPFARPAGGNWNGTGNPESVRVWRLDLIAHPLPGTLASAPDPVAGPRPAPSHAVVTTVVPGMELARFQTTVGATAAHWVIVPPPAQACPLN